VVFDVDAVVVGDVNVNLTSEPLPSTLTRRAVSNDVGLEPRQVQRRVAS